MGDGRVQYCSPRAVAVLGRLDHGHTLTVRVEGYRIIHTSRCSDESGHTS